MGEEILIHYCSFCGKNAHEREVLIIAFKEAVTGKWINYKLAYESGVRTTVVEMVKPECLVKP